MAGARGVSAFALISLADGQALDYADMWADFKTRYNKVYSGDEDLRFQIFVANVDYVEAENARNQSFTRGLNQFSDMTEEEVLPLLSGALATDGGERDSRDANPPCLGYHVRGTEPLPESVDWTTKGGVTPVKDQKICGSCWAFSGTAALEGGAFVATGKLVSLSEQQAMQCSQGAVAGHGCQGGWPYRVFEYAVDNDLCTEASYPYQGVDTIPCFWNVNPPQCSEVGVSKGLVSGYKKVTPNSEEELVSALAQAPVSIDVRTDGWLTYSGGIYTGCDAGKGTGHAVLAVGYTSEYWKVKNSWGTSWGEGGYIRLPRGTGPSGQGACNLLSEAAYPVVTAEVVV